VLSPVMHGLLCGVRLLVVTVLYKKRRLVGPWALGVPGVRKKQGGEEGRTLLPCSSGRPLPRGEASGVKGESTKVQGGCGEADRENG